MNKKIKHIGLLAILLSVLGMAISYSIPQGFWFSLVMGVSTSLFGVGLAVIVVNYDPNNGGILRRAMATYIFLRLT